MTRYSTTSMLLGWMVLALVSSCSSWHSHGRALAFSTTSSSSSFHRSHQQLQRSRPFTTTTRRFDSESDHHDWDVLQKKLQQKIQEQQQKENVVSRRNEEEEETIVLPTPNTDYTSLDVVTMCMNHLQDNHVPVANAGLQVCFDFSSDRCRAACGGSLSEFVEYAANPTFGMLLYCQSWKVLSVGPIIAGTPTRGAMQTVLMEVEAASSPTTAALASSKSKKAPPPKTPKRFLWTLQQERRPPRQGCWLVHEVMFTNNAFALTM